MLKKTLRHTGADAEMVTVAVFNNQMEADLLRSELEADGIEAWVINGTLSQTFMTLPETGVEVQVSSVNAKIAAEIISGRSKIVDDAVDPEYLADSESV